MRKAACGGANVCRKKNERVIVNNTQDIRRQKMTYIQSPVDGYRKQNNDDFCLWASYCVG